MTKYVIGMGNYSKSDDGIGLHLIEKLSSIPSLPFIPVEIAHDILRLQTYFNEDTESILIIDAVKMGLRPGEYKFFSPGDVESKKEVLGFSTHEGDILKIIELSKTLNLYMPNISIMGIEPDVMNIGMNISVGLNERMQEYVGEIMRWSKH